MTKLITDKAFVKGFREVFLAYLCNTIDPMHPSEHDIGHVSKNIQGVALNGIGYVSRIFDGIKSLPILTQAEFTSLASEHGGVDVLMQNILDEVSTFMLNTDKTCLHDDVIKALGTDIYQNLINQPDATPESIAKYFLAAVLSLYKQTLQANAAFAAKNFPYQSSLELLEPISHKLCTHIARNKLEVSLKDQNRKSNVTLGSPDELEAIAKHLLVRINKLIDENNVDIAEIEKIYNDFDKFRYSIMGCFNDLTNQFNQVIGKSMQEAYDCCLATGSAVATGVTADVPVGIKVDPKLSTAEKIEFLKTKLDTLSAMLNNMILDESLNSEEVHAYEDKTKEYFACAEKALALYESYKDGMTMSSDEDTATRMHECLNTGVQQLLSNIRPDELKVQPSKPLMHVFFRILRALFIWRMVSESEQADIERTMNQKNLVDELHAKMSNKPFLIEDKIEEITDIETHSRTTSGSEEELKFCSSPISSVGDNRELNQSPTGVADAFDYSEATFEKIYGTSKSQGFFIARPDLVIKKTLADNDISVEEQAVRDGWVPRA